MGGGLASEWERLWKSSGEKEEKVKEGRVRVWGGLVWGLSCWDCVLGEIGAGFGGESCWGSVLGQSFSESLSSLLLLLRLSAVSIGISSDGLFLGFFLFAVGDFAAVVFLVGAGSLVAGAFADGAGANAGGSRATAYVVLGVGTGSFGGGGLLFFSESPLSSPLRLVFGLELAPLYLLPWLVGWGWL